MSEASSDEDSVDEEEEARDRLNYKLPCRSKFLDEHFADDPPYYDVNPRPMTLKNVAKWVRNYPYPGPYLKCGILSYPMPLYQTSLSYSNVGTRNIRKHTPQMKINFQTFISCTNFGTRNVTKHAPQRKIISTGSNC
ncbi:unnamed protein product [Trifolium pratense]|uniref:Uncharacterized protein n=1 Tax=Trifolium pratense TaxID=57577 RepID=A0ACB0JC25_TRIPR|nr:unnamed protein product [Trifolium pratense]